MKITQLIKILEAKKKAHGNLTIRCYDVGYRAYFNIQAKEIKVVKDTNEDILCINVV